MLWVHTSEMADPYPYLLGGELLLSAGLTLKDPDAYVARLVEAGAAALGFGVTPVFDTVPRALIEACDRHGLPLVEVPPETPFTTIARAVWQLMAEARHRELRRVTRAQQALATAAARPDPVPAVLHQLAAQLGGRAVLLSADGEELHAAGRRPAPDVGAALARLTRVVGAGPRPAPTSATDTVRGVHLSAYALGGGQGLVLALGTDRREGATTRSPGWRSSCSPCWPPRTRARTRRAGRRPSYGCCWARTRRTSPRCSAAPRSGRWYTRAAAAAPGRSTR